MTRNDLQDIFVAVNRKIGGYVVFASKKRLKILPFHTKLSTTAEKPLKNKGNLGIQANLGTFNKDGTWQRKRIMRSPLFVFPYGFLRPLLEYEERFSFFVPIAEWRHGTRTSPILRL